MFKDSDSSNSKVSSEGRDEMRTATVSDETKIFVDKTKLIFCDAQMYQRMDRQT